MKFTKLSGDAYPDRLKISMYSRCASAAHSLSVLCINHLKQKTYACINKNNKLSMGLVLFNGLLSCTAPHQETSWSAMHSDKERLLVSTSRSGTDASQASPVPKSKYLESLFTDLIVFSAINDTRQRTVNLDAWPNWHIHAEDENGRSIITHCLLNGSLDALQLLNILKTFDQLNCARPDSNGASLYQQALVCWVKAAVVNPEEKKNYESLKWVIRAGHNSLESLYNLRWAFKDSKAIQLSFDLSDSVMPIIETCFNNKTFMETLDNLRTTLNHPKCIARLEKIQTIIQKIVNKNFDKRSV